MAQFTRSRLDSEFQLGHFFDCQIVVEDAEGKTLTVDAHRIVLAGSSAYFKAIFTSGATTAKVTMEHSIFEHISRFIYRGEAIVPLEEVENFLTAISSLGMTTQTPIVGSPSASGLNVKTEASSQELEAEIKEEGASKSLKTEPGTALKKEEQISESELKKMVLTNPETGKPQCGLCRKEFTRREFAINHLKAKHVTGFSYSCNFCDRQFKTPVYRSVHIHNKHLEANRMSKLLKKEK